MAGLIWSCLWRKSLFLYRKGAMFDLQKPAKYCVGHLNECNGGSHGE